jgi:hypothetical protein
MSELPTDLELEAWNIGQQPERSNLPVVDSWLDSPTGRVWLLERAHRTIAEADENGELFLAVQFLMALACREGTQLAQAADDEESLFTIVRRRLARWWRVLRG